MASIQNILYGILASTVFWTILGLPIAERIAFRVRAIYLAPALGWSIYSALALPLFSLIGLSQLAVLAGNSLLTVCALGLLWIQRTSPARLYPSAFEVFCLGIAMILAFVPMTAILPKTLPDGVGLAWPIFDHSKIAMIDEMVRSGVPAFNPFFHEIGTPGRLAYYYLWHFSAATVASALSLSGWEADTVLTWFTAFASLSMMMGFAIALGRRFSSAFWVVILAATGSIRPVLDFAVGTDTSHALIGAQTGFGSWLFQTTWAPQHVASAMAVILAVFLLITLAEKPTIVLTIVFGLMSAAGFQSSVWVGGIVFTLSVAMIAALFLTIDQDRSRHLHFIWTIAGAAGLCIVLTAPFIIDQISSAAARDEGFPLSIEPLWVFGASFPRTLGNILTLPAYWTLYLPAELPAYYPAGVITMALLLRRRWLGDDQRLTYYAFLILTIVSFATAWLAVSTIGDNNDLGWRAVLPAVFLLIVFAAVGITHWIEARAWLPCALVAGGFLCGLPSAIDLARENYVGKAPQSTRDFAASETMWQAAQRNTSATERVLNRPSFLSDMTPWPVNISWALLGDRRSCYASNELALPFAPVSEARRRQIDALFVRLFDGTANSDDISQISGRFGCDLVIITPQDGAWTIDPFKQTEAYRLVDEKPTWRMYKRTATSR